MSHGRTSATPPDETGHPEWVAETSEGYVQRAEEWSADLSRLADVRAKLRDGLLASPLMDARGFADRVEAAFRDVWRRWCAETR